MKSMWSACLTRHKPGMLRMVHSRVNYSVMPITCSQLKEQLDQQIEHDAFCKSVTVIEVRNRQEIEDSGKIKYSVNIPLPHLIEDPHRLLADFPKDRKLVFQCASGRRSHMAATKALEAGFTNVYNLEGGLTAWKAEYPLQPFKKNHSPTVHTILDNATDTAQYIVTDEDTRETILIDPVLDYDPFSGTVKADTAKQLIEFVQKYHLNVTKIIDTHVHADHLSAGKYLHQHLTNKPPLLIGHNVTKVQSVFRDKYNFEPRDLPTTGEQFSQLIGDATEWTLGNDIRCKAIATPGHTPACMSWLIGDALFAGDTLFMPDIGTARCDFPGGSAEQMYQSIHKIYDTLLDDTRVFVGHDYPSERPYSFVTFLEAHKRNNKMINERVSLEDYIKARKLRDDQLKAPRYLHPSLQTNLRGGDLPAAERRKGECDKEAGQFFKIPVRFIE
ncbi:hypothetical protein K450DRAFT_253893 [Umbelopsis ramanniana AG]|uniref:Rhodanese domain-containing protein n=1 Tax=Umbelopsis ramanniana AG TaxID=1314678 RepID=A0AAD5E7C3_UMBRA|nr:uncharacterized protein K450DRAFT_253893 [Umbelopsis ramanniana AG]KAI8577000.1 hypothetical protein K450DRAFT_253893 [Umbelopsis ramanniana AG]